MSIPVKVSVKAKDLLSADAVAEEMDDTTEYPSEGVQRLLNDFLQGVKSVSYYQMNMRVDEDELVSFDTCSCSDENGIILLLYIGDNEFFVEPEDSVTIEREGDSATLKIEPEVQHG